MLWHVLTPVQCDDFPSDITITRIDIPSYSLYPGTLSIWPLEDNSPYPYKCLTTHHSHKICIHSNTSKYLLRKVDTDCGIMPSLEIHSNKLTLPLGELNPYWMIYIKGEKRTRSDSFNCITFPLGWKKVAQPGDIQPVPPIGSSTWRVKPSDQYLKITTDKNC